MTMDELPFDYHYSGPMALPTKIANAKKKHSDKLFEMPAIDLKLKDCIMQAANQARSGKNDFEREIQKNQILSNNQTYQTLLKQKELVEREKDAAAIE